MSGTGRIKNRNYKIDRARKALGIPGQATAEEARKQYRALAKRWHPDVNPGKEAHIRMQELNGAYAFGAAISRKTKGEKRRRGDGETGWKKNRETPASVKPAFLLETFCRSPGSDDPGVFRS